MISSLVAPQWRPEVQQLIYKKMLTAISYPGEVQSLAEVVGEGVVGLALLATLVDRATCFADPQNLVAPELRHFIESDEESVSVADYMVVNEELELPDSVKNGTIYRPEDSATIIIITSSFARGTRCWTLTGPGIKESSTVWGNDHLQKWFGWREKFIKYPQGIDLFICDGSSFISIPRTTKVTDGHN